MSGTRVSGDGVTVALSADASGELPSMGERVGDRYELLGLVAVGGMGSVYRARDLELDEIVALKVIARELVASQTMLDRFRQEVKLARRVTHKNVARMFDIGEYKNLKFLTMEFIEGESLGDLLEREGPLLVARAAAICTHICEGLAAAHEAGIVHRDLKPDNVMLAKDGRVLITDFGIARAMASTAQRTQGMPVGTPAYMAPEQVEGAADIDARADIYALGVMIYEMLVGAQPFEGDSVFAIAAARLVRPPPHPQERKPDIPDPIAKMIVKCMQRRREDRYGNAREIAVVFESVTMPAMPSIKRSALAVTSAAAPSLRADSKDDGRKIVAVLPLKNAGSPDDAHLAEGLTEDIVDALSMAKGLRVRARGMHAQVDKGQDTGELGRALGVQVMVDGSLKRIDDMVRVTLRLVSVEDGLQLWAKRFERPVGDVLRIGDEAATAIASALTSERTDGDEPQVTADPVVIDLFLKARQEYHRTWHDATTRAIELFKRALERAPNDTKVLGFYSLALARRYAYEFGAEAAGPEAVQIAERTLSLTPNNSPARTALGVVHWNDGDTVGAAREIALALRTGPANGDAQDYCGRILSECGRLEDAIARLKMALAFEPRLQQASNEIVRACALLGRWDEAWSRLGEPPEDLALANSYWSVRMRLLGWQRKIEAIPPETRALVQSQGPFETKALVLGMLDAFEDPSKAATLASILMQFGDANDVMRRRSFFSQIVTEMWCIFGDKAAALEALERAADAKLSDSSWIDRCPSLEMIREEPRFKAVRERVTERARLTLEALDVPRV